MARNLSLSQAARLIGVTRKDIQNKIQQNKLIVMEGTVLLEDLKKAYPEAKFEDNTMLEKTQKLMEDAVYKMSKDEHEGAQLNALSRRAYKLNQQLAQQKAKADFYEQIVNQLKQKFIQISPSKTDTTQIVEIQQWLNKSLENYHIPSETEEATITDQIEQFMQPHVRLLPSRHDFVSDKSQTLLESALASGLAVDYGCNNGQCGKCKVKLLSGKVKQTKHSDYVFDQQEKNDNYILSCINSAVSDIVLETKEAVCVEDIPKQTINCKIKSLELLKNSTYILNLKTPRNQRLRFLAGQNVSLALEDKQNSNQSIKTHLAIASCPCDARNIQFHFSKDLNDTFLQSLIKYQDQINEITLEGPDGHFILDEKSYRSIVFIAEKTAFASIKSIIEHTLALDLDTKIQLIWIANDNDSLYLDNLCRSWNDALDNFSYKAILYKENMDSTTLVKNILSKLDPLEDLADYDFYLSASHELANQLKQYLLSQDCKEQHLHINR